MADPISSIIECIDPNLSLDTFDGFKIVINGFFLTLPNLISLDLVPKLAIDPLPKIVFDLFTASFPTDFPSFSIPGFGEFKGIDLTIEVNGLKIPGIDLSGLLNFIKGLFGILLSIPEIFIDFDLEGKPPVPKLKLPTLGDIELAIGKLIEVNLGLSPLIPFSLPEDFIPKFTNCLLKAATSIVMP